MTAKLTQGKHHSRPESLLAQTRRLLRHFGLRARKGLGQHFLVDEQILQYIISAAGLTPSDVVVEIGPGLGVLTRELVKQVGRVIAVELDDHLAVLLRQTLAPFDNLVVINEDILQVDPAVLLREQMANSPVSVADTSGYKVLANLPYYITSAVLRHFLEARLKPRIMVVMVQKEVAEAIVAEPGEMSVLSVSVQFYGAPKVIARVPAQCFYPAPKVDSAILRIDLYPRPAVEVSDKESFFELVRAGFTAPRKQIANSLAQGLGLPGTDVLPCLEKAGIASARRAETLTLQEWARLWQEFNRARKIC